MITKETILAKCQSVPGLQGLAKIIEPRDFTEAELESIDFVIEAYYSLKLTLETIKETAITKLEVWLASTKDTG